MDDVRQIVALGGIEGGGGAALDAYTLGLCQRTRPRLLIVPTGWGDNPETTQEFDDLLSPLAEVSRLLLIDRVVPDLRSLVLAQDVVWVGGGDTRNMLRRWRECGLDAILREAWDAGVVLTGGSAGAVCWFEDGISRTDGGLIPLGDGLGFLPGSLGVHDAVPDRHEAYRRVIAEGRVKPGVAAADGVGVHFVGTKLHRIVTARPEAAAYRVELQEGRIVEYELPAKVLG